MAFCHAGIASASGFMQARVPGESVWRSDWLVSLSHTASLEPFLVVENWNCCTDYLAPGQFYSMCPDTTPEDCGSGPHPLWLETFSE